MVPPAVATAPKTEAKSASHGVVHSGSQQSADTKLPSAAYDNKIYAKFSAKTIEKKAVNKEEFQKEFGLIPEKKNLLIGFPLPLTGKNGAETLVEMLPGIEATGIQLAILGIGTEKYQELLTEFAGSNEGHVTILENTEDNLRKLNAAVDCMFFFENNAETKVALENALSYGVVPLAEEKIASPLLSDYNPNQEKGNSFLFPSLNEWHVFTALVRAIENYKFPYDWKNISREGMNSV